MNVTSYLVTGYDKDSDIYIPYKRTSDWKQALVCAKEKQKRLQAGISKNPDNNEPID